MSQEVVRDATLKMEKALDVLRQHLVSVRAGRANPSLLDKIVVHYYGSDLPLGQVASINVPEPRMLLISPWDVSVLPEIERAIQKSDLGLSPSSDGKVIRIVLPPLTEERRKELVKVVRKYGEEAKVAIRNIRRDANDVLKKQEKEGLISEDEARRQQDEVQEATDDHIKKVDEIVRQKEEEIMEV
ncbi:MAG: ribosome recycling factor [Candidatus Carbobacillus altaicus]|uniref:Ribosome-recycling factor n=1 Tax=Candidatus Carbonibacillus altaicus TaxID=2163959 RepID=A0A2R6Y4W0_9BACL|nr:ribosome recycling factor [Candidatus Carbobacillus altaicus]PTQ57694.1 MAG: Ribosome recycling factor [Candidatus Carbobacillus altaicus]